MGIACVIALQQLPLALGIAKGDGEQTVVVAWHTLAMVAVTLGVKFGYPHLAQRLKLWLHVPPSFVAILVALLVAQTGLLQTHSIGNIPREIGQWRGEDLGLADISHLLWPAFLIALLCAIESLLAARVADSMVGAPEGALRAQPRIVRPGPGDGAVLDVWWHASDRRDCPHQCQCARAGPNTAVSHVACCGAGRHCVAGRALGG